MLTSLKTHLNELIPSKTTLKHFFLILLLGVLLTIIYTWPMVLKLPVLYNDQSDYSLVGWILWYNQLAFTTGRIFSSTDYFNSFQFYPWGYSLAFSENFFFPSLLFAPIFWITGQLVLSVNVYTFSTFIITFVISFYVYVKFLKNNLAAIISSLIFTFNPMTSAHFPGHTHLLGKFFLPLIFLSSYSFFSSPSRKNAFYLGLFFTLNALTSINFFIISVPSLLLISLPYLIIHIYKKDLKYFKLLLSSSLVFIVFIPILLFILYPYQEFSKKEGVIRTIDESTYYSAQLIDWLSPFPASHLYGSFVYSYENLRVGFPRVNYSEHSLALNIIPTFLFIFGCFFINKKTFKKNSLMIFSLLTMLIGTFIFTFGPQWEHLTLPYYYFNNITHLFDGIRVPTRFQFFFYLPFSLIAGYGFLKMLTYLSINKLLLSIFIISLIMIENTVAWDMDDSSFLTNNPPAIQQYRTFNFLENSTTLHLPGFTTAFEKQIPYLNLATIHNERLMNGYSGFFPPEWTELLKNIEEKGGLESLKKLHALKVDFLILHKKTLPNGFISDLRQKNSLITSLSIIDNEDYLILNLKNPQLVSSPCFLSRDIKIELIPLSSSHGETSTYFNQVKVTNISDCYMTNILQDRYLNSSFFINGRFYPTDIKMPVVIGPKEEILLK